MNFLNRVIIWIIMTTLALMGFIVPVEPTDAPVWAIDWAAGWMQPKPDPPKAPEYKKRPPTQKEAPVKNTKPIAPPTSGNCGNGIYDKWFKPCESQYSATMSYLSLVQSHFGGQTNVAMCVMYGESRGNASVTNSIGARGLFQLMPNWADNAWAGSSGISYADLLIPSNNVFVAKLVYNIQGWDAWSAYRRGYVADCINKKAFTAGYVFPGVPAPPPTTTTTTIPPTTITTLPPTTTTTVLEPTTTTTVPVETTTTTIPEEPTTTTTLPEETTTTTLQP